MKLLLALLVCFVAPLAVPGQELELPADALKDEASLAQAMPQLAKKIMAVYREPDRGRYLSNLFRLQVMAGQYQESIASMERLTELRRTTDPSTFARLLPFILEAKARFREQAEGLQFEESFKREFRAQFEKLNDLQASDALPWLSFDQNRARTDMNAAREKSKGKARMALTDALDLIRAFHLYRSLESWLPLSGPLSDEDDARRYVIDKDILVKTPDGARISAVMLRPKSASTPQPALFVFTIYAGDDTILNGVRKSAAHGYVGILGYTRGKGKSPETPVPFERDGDDARAVIDWIVKQPWSDGRVGMYSGSYNGFTQWATARKLHPALKTIVPSRASNAGNGLPMENNIFLLVNYAWAFYVTNNKYLDNEIYSDQARWGSLNQKWYESGASYRRVDSLDGTPNKWFQTWLQHPGYDRYWQQMVPYKEEFAAIDIPVLTLTGYYDDAQQSALWYLREHYKYRPRAEHYLVIGPYDHFGTDRSVKQMMFRGYALDPVAQFDTQELIFQWMDYIFRGATKPAILADKINYQVMGANEWKHARSLEKMGNEMLTLYLTDLRSGDKYQLSNTKPTKAAFLDQMVDFADRKTSNNDYYPDMVVGKKPDLSNGFAFISEPFDQPVEISGVFAGQIRAIINKKDMDIGVTLYEVMPNGELFHLSYFIGRASYANDMSVRRLLTPGKLVSIPFDRARIVSRLLSKGSRLLVTLNINKNAFAQINYGTGKDVSDEDVKDATIPLQIKWRNDSFVRIPIWK